MSEETPREAQAGAPENPEEQPQIYAVTRDANGVQFTRREFLELTAAAGAAVAVLGCKSAAVAATVMAPTDQGGAVSQVQATDTPPNAAPTEPATDTPEPTETPKPTRTSRPTNTPTPSATPTNTATSTPEKVTGKIKGNGTFYSGPSEYYSKLGEAGTGEEVTVLGKSEDETWLHVKTLVYPDAWIKTTSVTLPGSIKDIPVEKNIPPAPTGIPGGVPEGESGAEYKQDGHYYYLPCGAPIPAGAVCSCNCVTVPPPCDCDGQCSCAGQTHYWYPN